MMTSDTLVLEQVTLDDVPAITELWFAGFTDPGMRYLWPDTPRVRKWWDDANRHDLLNKSFQHYIKIVDPGSKDSRGRPRIVAYAKWDLATPKARGPRYPPWSEDMPSQACDAFFNRLESERQRVMAGIKEHYYLDMLVTHPDYQRRGAGSMLVKWGCDLADKNRAELYIDASKMGALLYQKFGFVDRRLEGDPESGVVPMARALRDLI